MFLNYYLSKEHLLNDVYLINLFLTHKNLDETACLLNQVTEDRESLPSEKIKIIDTVIKDLAKVAVNAGKYVSRRSLSSEATKVLTKTQNLTRIAFTLLIDLKQMEENLLYRLKDIDQGAIVATKDFKNQNIFIQQIKVLDQYYKGKKLGKATCGFHAFKNSLIAIGLAAQVPGISASCFQSEEIFEAFYYFLLKFQPQDTEDISIATLTIGLRALTSDKEPIQIDSQSIEIPPILKPFQKLLKENFSKITILNPDLNSDYAGLTADTLFYLSNFAEFQRSPGPRSHTFMMGSNGHWVSLFVYKDREGKLSWYGLDSYKNNPSNFENHIKILSKALSNPIPYIKKNFKGAVGEDLERKVQWFNSDGLLKKEEYIDILFTQQEEYKKIITQSFDLMKKLGWLDNFIDSEISQIIKNLRILTNFYAQLEIDVTS